MESGEQGDDSHKIIEEEYMESGEEDDNSEKIMEEEYLESEGEEGDDISEEVTWHEYMERDEEEEGEDNEEMTEDIILLMEGPDCSDEVFNGVEEYIDHLFSFMELESEEFISDNTRPSFRKRLFSRLRGLFLCCANCKV